MEYIKIGKCIWCLKEKPNVTFKNAPHTISKQIGASNIGFDICDSCNSYFGTHNKTEIYPMNVELAFKEVFNVIRLFVSTSDEIDHFRSRYFNYYKSKREFKINRQFKFQRNFINMFTRQFKRGIYETFLQEYHLNTSNAMDKRFDSIRDFVRYDKGNLSLYYVDHNGAIMIPRDYSTSLAFNEKIINDINEYGFYTMYLLGFWFFLEVTPRAELSKDIFLLNQSRKLGLSSILSRGIKKLDYITDLDFTLQRLKNS